MASRNITLNLPEDLIQKTKAEAAQRGKTVSAFVGEILEQKLTDAERVRRAAERLLALSEKGPLFSGDPRSISRDELHERRR